MNWRLVVAVAISMYGVILVVGLVAPLLLIAGQPDSNQGSSMTFKQGAIANGMTPLEIGVVAFSHTAASVLS